MAQLQLVRAVAARAPLSLPRHAAAALARVYTTSFSLSAEELARREILLVFDGIKMGADIALNGRAIGRGDDQYLRYIFPIRALAQSQNTLTITFPAFDSIATNGRFMACTGGWDWAPYTNTVQVRRGVAARSCVAHAHVRARA